ncbi:MAG: hypothetical protein WBG02_05550 [Candidatus Acidiferrum sp.]
MAEKVVSRIERAELSSTEAAPTLAIKNFLAAMESDDSLFRIAQPLAGPAADESSGGRVYSGDAVLEFRQAEHRSQRTVHFLLLEKLTELLKEAGSREALEVTLCLTSASIPTSHSEVQSKPDPRELALWLRLDATGDSPEQAVLRWGLGLAHIQQALLFTSRHLRLHMAHAGN